MSNFDESIVSEMAADGVIFGHKKTKTHPKMKPYIFSSRNEIEIFEPEIIWNSLQKAQEFLKGKIKSGEKILFVATQAGAKNLIAELAQELNMPYVTNRWLGGTLTNFKVISQRLKYYLDLKSKKEKGELMKYSKKEQMLFNQQLEKLARNFDGLINLTNMPEAIFIIDPSRHQTAIHEARLTKTPIIAVADNDDDPSIIDYPIIANDHSPKSLSWLIQKIKDDLRNVTIEKTIPAEVQKQKNES
ncbi:30S ribosomal protein S2 [Candidatus Jorgensenbacteria bacterium CG_4_10_14_0_8_um_filter_39_13]|uniref:Small ribosomal subunit protein uS2 n=2 Tax=Candidatus Joergenseniibacteriota TaxID=1752739 RepID=A0A2M7RIC2_9BACT|nr:MAG: 30S ribosomal protein S2 [Candidatus Jorgensenbacteria bacterium CG11_big_fil_rev_8_21_14_0_20_38_23]PIV13432.1 MAG: 30S ribosomal protein S2 [Candidatus Jorgensenbacteria bacterium CG03_land_8_20_14_0_80_38_39]PIW97426.1 MAG: 30S ribosomal protein S2 [Candidatus Jorgensenbacteria bacterium CG_4_8_14_3_um_filter_38_10]PIY96489.1 MAG: 30S ribosomal protein S2 [Candidatus Jorgensenbacteria bacterium CG_4_10_14_0_8_um_filter_39_13]PJA95182.1 MAG: 30S ribosomal protein S2 [Candidatus Jorgen